MSFASWSDFFAMGGHGLYVWLSFIATTLVVVGNALSVRRERARFLREARAVESRAATALESARAERAARDGVESATGTGRTDPGSFDRS